MDPYEITFSTWNKIADLYQEKFMDLDLYDDSYSFLCSQLPMAAPKILEIGCGPGNITRYLLKEKPEAKILATDIAPNMITLAKENCPDASFQILDGRAINQLKTVYDTILCGFCMPYMAKDDVEQFILDAYGLLNAGGLFYFSTIEGAYEKSGCQTGSTGDQAYIYYYSEIFLNDLIEKNKFNLVKLFRKKYTKGSGVEEVHLIFVVKK